MDKYHIEAVTAKKYLDILYYKCGVRIIGVRSGQLISHHITSEDMPPNLEVITFKLSKLKELLFSNYVKAGEPQMMFDLYMADNHGRIYTCADLNLPKQHFKDFERILKLNNHEGLIEINEYRNKSKR